MRIFGSLPAILILLAAAACLPARTKHRVQQIEPARDVVEESLGLLEPEMVVFDSALNGYGFEGVPRSLKKTAFRGVQESDAARKAEAIEEVWAAVKEQPLDREYFARYLFQAYGELGKPARIDALLEAAPIRNSRFGIDAISSAADGYVAAGTKFDEARALLARAFAIQLGFERMETPAGSSTGVWKKGLKFSRERLLSKLGRLELRAGNTERAVRAFEAVVALEDAAFSRQQLAGALEKIDIERAAEEYGYALSLSDTEDPELLAAIERLGPPIDPSAVVARSRADRSARRRAARLQSRLGEPVPEFKVRAESGEEFDRENFRSADVTVVQFFSTTCGFCRAELPILQRLRERYPDRARVRFVVFGERQGLERFRAFFENEEYDFELAYDGSESAWTAFQVRSVPTLLVIGPEQRVEYRHSGFREGLEAMLDEEIEALLSTTAD